MDVRFVLPELKHLDEVKCEAIAIPFFADERPLQGTLGLIDWRMCGLISHMIVRQRIHGSLGETILLPGRPRLSMEKLFLFGLGKQEDYLESMLDDSIIHVLKTLSLAGVRTSALVLPGRTTQFIPPESAMEAFLRTMGVQEEHDEVIVVETKDGQKSMIPVVERARRRARAYME